jgi:hypothetical protein
MRVRIKQKCVTQKQRKGSKKNRDGERERKKNGINKERKKVQIHI